MGLLGLSNEELNNLRTMHLEDEVKGASIIILIDSGVSHNFIAPPIAATLELKVDYMRKLAVGWGMVIKFFPKGDAQGFHYRLGKFLLGSKHFRIGRNRYHFGN